MDNKFIIISCADQSVICHFEKQVTSNIVFSKLIDMNETNYWLMKSERDWLLLGFQGIVIFYSNFTQTFTD